MFLSGRSIRSLIIVPGCTIKSIEHVWADSMTNLLVIFKFCTWNVIVVMRAKG